MFDEPLVEKVKRAALAMQRHNWEQGTVAQAFLEAGETEIAILMAREAAYRQDEMGRCGQIGSSTSCTDPCSIGEALIYACEETHDPLMEKALEKLLDWALRGAKRNALGIVYHLNDAPQFWVDSFYMLPPFLARAGYYDEAVRQIDGYWQSLFNEDVGLLSHIRDDAKGTFVRDAFWGVGNGWAMAGLMRVIAMTPPAKEHTRAKLIQRLKTIIDSALKYQRPDGLFNDVLDNEDTFAETNFAQMMAYTIFRAVSSKILDRSYLSAAVKMREAARNKVDRFGLVADVCGAPTFDKAGFAPEGQAFFIMMEAAWQNARFEF